MRIAIVDDEKRWRDESKNIVYDFYNEEEIEVSVFENGTEYLEKKECYDITLVDIVMPGPDGFEVITKARRFNPNGIFIILTTKMESSRKGFLVNAFRYIDKDYICDELTEALKSVDILRERNRLISVNIIGEGERELKLKNIIYIETEKRYIVIHTKQGDKKSSNTLTEMESILGRSFFRCHNVYIVNLDEVEKVDKMKVSMSNGDELDVSVRKNAEFRRAYIDREYECANA